jgi:hypothetical protein
MISIRHFFSAAMKLFYFVKEMERKKAAADTETHQFSLHRG